ncbi:rRNA maturation RNase YbeY [Desulfovibrio sp. OttesenSCG-928-O18]|nr:rRNA maturation RNase YbeY [Desulfovibrio sp. OttesenSCG-928-O18]
MKGEITVRRNAGFAWQVPFSRRELVAVLMAMREACGLNGVPLDVTLTDDAVIARANAEHLLCAGPTNILSFPPFAGFGPGLGTAPGKGILVLSLDTLHREALLYGQDVAEHALRLFAHGMAHLAGLDHGEEMDALQAKVFAAGAREWSFSC